VHVRFAHHHPSDSLAFPCFSGSEAKTGGREKAFPLLFPSIADSFFLPPPRQQFHIPSPSPLIQAKATTVQSSPLLISLIQSLPPSLLCRGAIEIGMHFILFLVFFLIHSTQCFGFLRRFCFCSVCLAVCFGRRAGRVDGGG
jgi:hypothetical protein